MVILYLLSPLKTVSDGNHLIRGCTSTSPGQPIPVAVRGGFEPALDSDGRARSVLCRRSHGAERFQDLRLVLLPQPIKYVFKRPLDGPSGHCLLIFPGHTGTEKRHYEIVHKLFAYVYVYDRCRYTILISY